MNTPLFRPLRHWIALAVCMITAACGGGGGGSSGGSPPPPAPTYAVGGTVNGLAGTVVLQNNGGNDLTVTTNGAFRFATALATGGAYSVTVKTQPATQTCVVTNGTGAVNTVDISTVVVTCTNRPTFAVGGAIAGLTGNVVLANASNAGQVEELTVGANGGFTFLTLIAAGNSYGVTVKTQPPNQICLVSRGSGTIGQSAVTDVAVTCTTNAAGTFSVGGSVVGLTGTVVLTNAFGAGQTEDLTVDFNGNFTFPTAIAANAAYAVSVKTQPVEQSCTVANPSGVMGAVSVTNVVVSCVPTSFGVGGRVTGLSGAGLVLQNNGVDDLAIGIDGPFSFTTRVASGSAYNVTVKTSPSNQTCVIDKGSGVIGASDVSDIVVTCTTNAANTFSVGGSVAGLTGTVVLRNTFGAGQLEERTLTADGPFTFPTRIATNGAYAVSVAAHPTNQACTIVNAVGTIGTVNVTNVAVNCTAPAAAVLQADPGVRSATLTWNTPLGVGAPIFNVYVSTQRNCDIGDAGCLERPALTNVTSPLLIPELRNGQAYFFKLESVFANGEHLPSNEAGARPNALAFNDTVNALAVAADGTVYMGGQFGEVGIATGSAVPLDAVTGRISAPDFPLVVGEVFEITADRRGGWYLGGQFTSVGGVARNNVAHVRFDGTVDPDWNPNPNGFVSAIAVSVSGDTVYVGGGFTRFTAADGTRVQRSRLAAFRADNGALTNWNPNPNSTVNTLAVSGDVVIAGGIFTHSGVAADIPRNRLAAFNTTDGAPTGWNPGLIGSRVETVAVSEGVVYVGGQFTEAGGSPRTNLAAFDLDELTGAPATNVPTTWDPRPNSSVRGLAVSGDGTVYAAGSFSQVNVGTATPAARFCFAAFDADGVVTGWNPRVDSGGERIAVSDDGRTVYIGGTFSRVNLGTDDVQPRHRLAQVDATTGKATAWNINANSEVRALAVSGATVYIGGSFTSVGSNIVRNRLAAVAASGALTAWNPDANLTVNTLQVFGNTVYVGGQFTQVAGATRNRLAAIDVSGALQDWNPNATGGVFGVTALALSNDGQTVFAGGDFIQIDGVDRHGFAAIDTGDGKPIWAADPNVDGPVRAIEVSGGTVYVGGEFQNVGATRRPFLAALDAVDGTLRNWNPQPDRAVRALAASDDTVYAGGEFSLVNVDANGMGPARNFLAAFNLQGVATSWDPDVDGPVNVLVVSGQTVYAGGSFSRVGTGAAQRSRGSLAAFDANGNATGWDPKADSTVNALVLSAGTTAYVGGFFFGLGNEMRVRFGAVDATTGELIP